MRIIRQSDTSFRYHNPSNDDSNDLMSEDEWFEKARLGPTFDRYSIDNHEAAMDAYRLGFVGTKDWKGRLYKVDDHDIIHEIYPRGHSSSETYDEVRNNPRWMMKVSNIPESPDVMSRHQTLDDALEASRNSSWKRGVKRPKYDNYFDEVKALPTGTPFITHPFARILDPDYAHQSGDPWQEGTAQGNFLREREKTIKHFHDAWHEETHDPYSRQDFERWG